ncbi:Ig-like domain-containing protein [Cellulomonas xylanilytica]|uniref:ATPase AAA n=1 Tax=Cellulomonas xylanilytica TaxID=233583 RepID=A0A510V141_9CELL|nr:fibronectin type III domain-containing protein [Cellulomonas xylanilytica]GEK19531.1 ATPase AAA [Cellulomonas xylanilytica]
MRWRAVRSRATTAAAVVTVPVLVLVLALFDQGFPLARLDLNDGGVWLTATSKLQLGRYNAQVEELNGGLSAAGSTFDVLQDEGDVLLVEPGSIAVVDPASVTLATQVAVPGAKVSMAAGVVAVVDPDGNVWVRSIADLDTLRIATDAPDVELGEGGAAVVARSGAVLAVAAEDGAVTRVDLVDGTARSTPVGTVGAGPVDQVTAVGDVAVVLSDGTVRTPDGEVEVDGDGLVLQQPGPEASRVLVASRTALLEVPLDGGSPVEHPTAGSGVPAEPVQVGRCAHGAWASAVGSYLQLCDGDDAEVSNLEEMSSADVLKFRVNRQVVVLNDTLRGRLWMPLQDTDLRVPNWTQIEPEEEPDEAEEETEASDTTQDLVTECSAESAPPTAADDEFGVRPGRTTILPVIDNDSSSDCGILAISVFDPLPAEFGTVEAIYGGRSLQVAVAEGATGTAELTYTITDGRGTNAPSTARVVLTARDGSLDSPPVQLRTGALQVEQGGQADHQALADFQDPDGDDLVLVGATADPASGSVRFRQDGSVTFRADGAQLGRTSVTLLVSDGTSTTEGRLDVDVRPTGSLPPQIDPVHAVTYVDQPVTLHPLDLVRSSSAEPPRLAGVDEVVGATITTDLQGGTFTFSAARAGSYYVPFLVSAPPQQATGLARIDVRVWPETDQPPIAVRDQAFLPADGEVTVDPLANDTDPAGKVLVLQSVDAPDGLRVAILEHHLVQISSERTLTAPVALRYTVSNGQDSTVGEIIVHPVPPSATSQPPVVPNVEVDVRTGGVVTIPVLDDAYDPDGDRLTLRTELVEPLGTGEGLLFVSGDVLRYQAPDEPLTARATFEVEDATGNLTAATVTVRVHASDASTKAPPRPKDLVARVFQGDTVRIYVPLVGIDPDGDGVTLLGIASSALRGRVVATGADWLEYQAFPDEVGTDEFTYAVEDWVGQRAVATVRVGISPRPTDSATVVARDDEVTVKPGQRVEVRVLANDVDSSGGDLALDPVLEKADGVDAVVEDRRIVVRAPDEPAVLQIVYTASNKRGGRDTGVLTVTVSADAPVLPPIARDIVVPATDTLDRTEVAVDVLAVAQNPSGPLSDLEVSVPGSQADVARVTEDGQVVVTLVDHAQTVPYLLTNRTGANPVASYAFITVPALGFFRPVPRPKAPELRVASGERLVIPLGEQVQVAPGRTARIADSLGVSATRSDGTSPIVDDETLQFTSAPGYAGPASITVPVTDASSPGDTSARTSVITLQITVYAVDDYPPTFEPSTIDVAPGEPALAVDLRSFTTGPEGANPTDGRYAYTLVSAIPAGFSGAITDGVLSIAADATTPKGRNETLAVRVGYGRTGSFETSIGVRVIASTRPTARVVDRTIDGVEGRQSTVDVLEGAFNPFAPDPMTVVGATVETPGAGTAGATASTVSVRPAEGFIGQMVTRFRVRDVTGDPDREVEGRVTVVVRGKPATPNAPRVGEIRDRTVVLSWDAPDNRGAPITGYRVVASPGNLVRQCASTTCTIDGLTNDVEYTFTVAAQNEVDWSEPSGPSAPARPDAVPDAPSAPTLDFGDGSVRATWPAPASAGSPITSYTLEISPAPPAGPSSVTSPTTSYTFSGLRNGTAYSVRVRAHNKAAEPSGWSPSSQPMVPAGVPEAPLNLTALRAETTLGGQINVAWTEPDGNGDRVTGYELVISGGPNSRTVPFEGTGTTSYAFTDAANGAPYQFSVRARNKAPGWSAPAVTTASTYGVPAATTITSAVGAPTAEPGDGSVRVVWASADPNGSPVTSYRLFVNGTDIGDVGTGTSRDVGGLTGGADATFQVQACNVAGCGEWSAPRSASPVPVTKPSPASGVSLDDPARNDDRQPTSITARWAATSAWGGGSGTVYRVDFSIDGVVTDTQRVTGLTATSTASMPTLSFLRRSATFRVVVTAETSAGASTPAPSADKVVQRASEPGDVADGYALTVSDDGASISSDWADVQDTGGAAITGYLVQVKVGSDGWADMPTTGTSQLSNAPLPAPAAPGTAITIRVRAQNQFGTSQRWAQSVEARVPEPPPATP